MLPSRTLSLADAAVALREGQIGVIPTDTVYGIVALAANEKAVNRLYAVKSRDRKPGTVIASSTTQLRDLGIVQTDIDAVAMWWPNPLTAVLPLHDNAFLHQGLGSLAVRVVADPMVRQLLEQTGPLLTSSANLPGHPEATTIDEAFDYFKDAVDFYIDGGIMADRLPSTIIRPSAAGGIEILRQGSIHL